MGIDDKTTGSVIRGLNRRGLLRLLGGTAAASFAGKLHAQASNAVQASHLCVVRPEQTEGPYFVDEKLLRSDLRVDPADNSVRPGLPLHLRLRVWKLADNNCSPLEGVVVDVWHNDARGEYSDVRDRKYDNRGKKFLRGYQITDQNGVASFVTVYPGWYPGRTVHIHFKLRTDASAGRGSEFTSQLYFDDTITDEVHRNSPYAANGQRSTRNHDDRIFRRGGEELMLRPSRSPAGYEAVFDLGLASA